MKYSPVPISKLVAETPELANGETTEKPRPAPNDNNTSVNAQEATAPARTAAHETPAFEGSSASSTITASTSPISSITLAGRIACSIKNTPNILNSMSGKMLECEESSSNGIWFGAAATTSYAHPV